MSRDERASSTEMGALRRSVNEERAQKWNIETETTGLGAAEVNTDS